MGNAHADPGHSRHIPAQVHAMSSTGEAAAAQREQAAPWQLLRETFTQIAEAFTDFLRTLRQILDAVAEQLARAFGSVATRRRRRGDARRRPHRQLGPSRPSPPSPPPATRLPWHYRRNRERG